MPPRPALVFDAHEYVAGAPSTCSCPEDHAPCADCGAADGSYVHTEEAKEKNFVLVQHVAVEAADASAGTDSVGTVDASVVDAAAGGDAAEA